jgi:hypothetical protein
MPQSRTPALGISGLPILSSLAATILTPMVMCLAGVAVILAFLIPLGLAFSFVIPLKLFRFFRRMRV